MTRRWANAFRVVSLAALVTTAQAAEIPRAAASIEGIAINGAYTATSDGVWAKTNEVYHDEVTVISTWTITTSCTTAFDCAGQMSSDAGWSAPIRYVSGLWFVTRTIDRWERCADGTTGPGKQIYKFYPDPTELSSLIGWDSTVGLSGACGINRPLAIEMPFRLVPR